MIIDSHQHFWNYEAEKHSWIDDKMSVIRRDFLSDDLQKVFDENGVDACVAVQAVGAWTRHCLRLGNFFFQFRT